jgi:hypothetical protein
MTNTTIPTRPGQLVVTNEGTYGITTTDVAKRTPTIGVQLIGGRYPVSAQVYSLTVVDSIPVVSA